MADALGRAETASVESTTLQSHVAALQQAVALKGPRVAQVGAWRGTWWVSDDHREEGGKTAAGQVGSRLRVPLL